MSIKNYIALFMPLFVIKKHCLSVFCVVGTLDDDLTTEGKQS